MRNENVEKAVRLILDLVDRLSAGEVLGNPAPARIRALFDNHVDVHGGSVRLACIFLTSYSVVEPSWDYKTVPTGVRGTYGDKLLATELNFRHVTFHKNITAFGENLGWKGAVRQFDLSQDIRFSNFLHELSRLDEKSKRELLNHIVWRIQTSRVLPQALPPLPASFLTYARSLELCEKLLDTPSEGHIQQFLVAAFLEVHRKRFGHRVSTHHPHASDKFDRTFGDIEEFRDHELVAAYEVTVRSDWKNRLPDFEKKIREAKLPKYIIIASEVRNDRDLSPASHLVDFSKKLHFDLAVVDIKDFFAVFCAELNREEIEQAINHTYQMLSDPKISGREDIITKFRQITNAWLES